MDFSKYEEWMGKTGWKRGDGLGKNRDGITKAIHIDKKKNTFGVGSTGFQHDNNWWDRVWDNKKIGSEEQNELFESRSDVNNSKKSDDDTDNENDKVNNKNKNNDDDDDDNNNNNNNNDNNLSCKGGIKSKNNKKDKIMNEITKEVNKKEEENKTLVFGQFKKSSFILESETLESIEETEKRNKEEETERLESIKRENDKLKSKLNFDSSKRLQEEFEACKGRTLRKYAPIGKLERLKAQDEGRYDPSLLAGDGGQKYEDFKRKLVEEKDELRNNKKQRLENENINNKENDQNEMEHVKKDKKDKKDKKHKKDKKEKKEKKEKRKSNSDDDDNDDDDEKKVKKDKKEKKKSKSSKDSEEKVEKKNKKDKKDKKSESSSKDDKKKVKKDKKEKNKSKDE
ncbi:hypothetical protein ACTFIY_006540 [Dictyostelium cf. discoideum]